MKRATVNKHVKNRAPSLLGKTKPSAVTMNQRVKSLNGWREQYNPLRSLTIARAISLLEAYQRGEYADVEWAFYFIEMTDADLMALIERRTSAILQLDWNVKISESKIPDAEKDTTRSASLRALAEKQADFLKQEYDRMSNLYEAIEHLAMASFRGFSVIQPQGAHFEILDQWNFIRDGLYGDYFWNPEAKSTSASSFSPEDAVDPSQVIVREVRRPINRVALIKFIRSNLSEKDWDSLIEIYGIPGVFIIGPQDVPEDKETEYQEAAEDAAEGGSGYLPYGSDVKFPDSVRGVQPFKQRLDHLSEKLILAGTGGMLTMLNQPTGIGGGQADAHEETFKAIARSEARKISEVFQKQNDKRLLERAFPGQPILAYFELAANEEVDTDTIVAHTLTLSQAGYEIDVEELSEKTGYKLTKKLPSPAPAGISINRATRRDDPVAGRLLANARTALAQAFARDLQPLRIELENILQIEDPEDMRSALEKLRADLPTLLKQMNASPESARILEALLGASLVNGYAEANAARK